MHGSLKRTSYLSDFYHYTKMDMPILDSAIPLDIPPQAKYHLFNLILPLFYRIYSYVGN